MKQNKAELPLPLKPISAAVQTGKPPSSLQDKGAHWRGKYSPNIFNAIYFKSGEKAP